MLGAVSQLASMVKNPRIELVSAARGDPLMDVALQDGNLLATLRNGLPELS